jgi:hypothetical protein
MVLKLGMVKAVNVRKKMGMVKPVKLIGETREFRDHREGNWLNKCNV